MPRAGFEPTIPGFERLKTVRALDSTAIATGTKRNSGKTRLLVESVNAFHSGGLYSKHELC